MIKNIVFDVGNVLVEWNPLAITQQAFPDHDDHLTLAQQLFKSDIWRNLNRGFFSEEDALQQYQLAPINVELAQLNNLPLAIRESLRPIPGGIELLKTFHQANWPVYALTDNVYELVHYLKSQYDFWDLFHGTVVSADLGVLKPDPKIYRHLLDGFNLQPEETLFLDDVLANVEGARNMGMQAIQFQNIKQCLDEMRELGIASSIVEAVYRQYR